MKSKVLDNIQHRMDAMERQIYKKNNKPMVEDMTWQLQATVGNKMNLLMMVNVLLNEESFALYLKHFND